MCSTGKQNGTGCSTPHSDCRQKQKATTEYDGDGVHNFWSKMYVAAGVCYGCITAACVGLDQTVPAVIGAVATAVCFSASMMTYHD